MAICKFFQQGYCRYGPNCRFEHVYGSKYNYQANSSASIQAQAGMTDDQILSQVKLDAQAALQGGQWILSGYSPFKDCPGFPGFIDLSPEEARLFIYEGKVNNNVDQAISYMNNLIKEAKVKYEHLLSPSQPLIKVLRSLYKGEAVLSSPFSNFGPSPINEASSVFRNAVQNSSPFSKEPNSIFGQANNSIFSSKSPDNSGAKSIFAQANQSIFGPNQLQNNPFPNAHNSGDKAKSIFAQATQNVFGESQTKQTNTFGNQSPNIFGSGSQPLMQNSQFSNATQNIFQTTDMQSTNGFNTSNTNVFGQNVGCDDNGVYSKTEDLSKEDLEHYRSDSYKLGFIPELPPPFSFCT